MIVARRLRQGILIAVGLLAIGATLAWRLYRSAPPTRSGPGRGSRRPPSPGGNLVGGAVLLIGLGDSVTAGYGASPDHSYFGRLVSNPRMNSGDEGICLKSVFPTQSDQLQRLRHHFGRARRGAAAETRKGGPGNAGIVVMTTGGNDLIHNYGRSPRARERCMGRGSRKRSLDRPLREALHGMFGRSKSCSRGCHVSSPTSSIPRTASATSRTRAFPVARRGAVLHATNDVLRRSAAMFPFVHVVSVHDAFRVMDPLRQRWGSTTAGGSALLVL